MGSTVSSVALRFAPCKIAEIKCCSPAESVLVKVVSGGAHSVYVVVIPREHCEAVYHYLCKYAQIAVPNAGDPLILTAVQAKRVIDAAYGFITPPVYRDIAEEKWEEEQC